MKRFLVWLALLFVVFGFINLLYLKVIEIIDLEFRKVSEISKFQNKDFRVLILGNSTSLDGINAEILGTNYKSAYNLSVGGASLETSQLTLLSYLKNNQAPELVLLCLSSCHQDYSALKGLNPIIDHYFSEKAKFRLSELPLYKFRWLLAENLKRLISKDHRTIYFKLGQLRSNRVITDNSNIGDSCNSPNYERGYPFLWDIASMCRNYSIELVIVEMPCWARKQNNIPVLSEINNKSDTLNIINVNNINVCDSILIKNSSWLSEDHLNNNGAAKVTDYIVKILKILDNKNF